MRDFKSLKVWEKSHRLVLRIYQITSGFPRHEEFGLRSQIRRAAVSVPTNIAEGCGRRTDAELSHFLQIAMGSSSELEYLLLLAHNLDYIKDDYENLQSELTEVRKMLNAFLQKLNANR
jgi:four helix bundle protein